MLSVEGHLDGLPASQTNPTFSFLVVEQAQTAIIYAHTNSRFIVSYIVCYMVYEIVGNMVAMLYILCFISHDCARSGAEAQVDLRTSP